MAVRAKFLCDGIDLRPGSITNPEVLEAMPEEDHTDWSKVMAKAKELDLPTTTSIRLPTVRLSPVYAGPDASDEDKSFWDATPQGKIELTITNAEAAEFYELNEKYYVTFEPAGS